MIDIIIYSCINVIHPVLNMGISFMNIHHEFKIIYKYEDKLGCLCRSIV